MDGDDLSQVENFQEAFCEREDRDGRERWSVEHFFSQMKVDENLPKKQDQQDQLH